MSRPEDRPKELPAEPVDALAEADAFELERACDRFEEAWRSGRPLSIEAALQLVPERLRSAALRELVAIDIERRGDGGERVSADDYRNRFPELTKIATRSTAADGQPACDAPADAASQAASGAITNATNATAVQSSNADEPQPGDDVGDYRLLEKLGAGGMGTVFKAVHRHMGRVVALKALQSRWLSQSDLAKRFEREVRAAARLNHPNVVAAFDAREQDGRRWLVTEYLEGIDLSKLIRREGPLSVDVALSYLLQAARGLEYAHSRGLVHRDVKPGNLFLTNEGTVKVLDLGLSRFVALDDEDWIEPLTSSGAFLGTASFVAPEQARNSRKADGRADIYSLGCTLHYLLVGKPPFRGDTTIDVLIAQATEPPPELPDFGLTPDRAERLRKIYGRMTARRPEQRYESMGQVVGAIEGFLGLLPARSAPDKNEGVQAIPRSRRSVRPNEDQTSAMRSRAWTAASLALSLVAGAIAWGIYSQSGRVERNVPTPLLAPQRAGLFFDGAGSYVELRDFQATPDQPATVEALARPDRAKNGNVISWMGPNWMALYLSSDGRWGVAKQTGATSQLLQANDPAPLDRFSHVVGAWDGERLRLYVDGAEIPATAATFSLPDTAPGLFIGGVPQGRLPVDQEDRFFSGAIQAVRISRGVAAPAPMTADPAEWKAAAATVALFRFGEGTGTETTDEVSGNRAAIHRASWVGTP